MCLDPHQKKGDVGLLNLFKPSSVFFADRCKAVLLCIFLIVSLCYVMSVFCSLVVNCWEGLTSCSLVFGHIPMS